MGGRTMPWECPHGKVMDWGDFGPDEDGSVGVERCEVCEQYNARLTTRLRRAWFAFKGARQEPQP